MLKITSIIFEGKNFDVDLLFIMLIWNFTKRLSDVKIDFQLKLILKIISYAICTRESTKLKYRYVYLFCIDQ